MSIYVIPALVALIAKVVILVVAYRSIQKSRAFFNMVVVFAIHNLCEVLIFFKFGGGNIGYVLIAYYIASVWGLALMLFYALKASRYDNRYLTLGVIAVAAVISVFMGSTSLLIGGERAIGYALTAVRGPFYWTFQLYSLVMYAVVVSVLIHGYRRAQAHTTEIQCLSILCALAPLMLFGCIIMILMNLGYAVNATGVLPIATSAFLAIILLGESKHNLTDVRRFLPWSPEKRTSNEIMDIFSNYARDEVDYRQAVSDIEKLLVVHKYQKNGENASVTAELMGMPRSSLYSIFNRLKIESKEAK